MTRTILTKTYALPKEITLLSSTPNGSNNSLLYISQRSDDTNHESQPLDQNVLQNISECEIISSLRDFFFFNMKSTFLTFFYLYFLKCL